MPYFEYLLNNLPEILETIKEKNESIKKYNERLESGKILKLFCKKKEKFECKAIYAGTLEEMKNKYKDLIKTREKEIRESIEKGYFEIFLLGRHHRYEFAFNDRADDILRNDNETILWLNNAFSTKPIRKEFFRCLEAAKKFTIKDLEDILYN